MQLLYQPASPFVAKVRMAAAHLGIDLELVTADATNQAPELLERNPLGKIPCLVDGDDAVYDSRVIVRYLDDRAGGALRASDVAVQRYEALCDGIADAAVAYQYEMRFRAEEKWEQSWLDRQWGKVERGLHAAERDLPPFRGDLHVGSVALFAVLGYLDLRYAGRWEDGAAAARDWQKRFADANPALAALVPSA